jgi:hypothetical protein
MRNAVDILALCSPVSLLFWFSSKHLIRKCSATACRGLICEAPVAGLIEKKNLVMEYSDVHKLRYGIGRKMKAEKRKAGTKKKHCLR